MNNYYTLFHCHDSYSILDGYSSPKENAKRAKELGMKSLGISNHGNTYSHIQHHSACKKAGVKPILGIELYVVHKDAHIKDVTNKQNSHMVIWAKNKVGWKTLNDLVSHTNDPEIYYYKPRISLYNSVREEDKKEFYGLEHFLDGNIMGFSGHQGSHLSDILFSDIFSDDPIKKKADIRLAYAQYKEKDLDFYKKFLREDWLEKASELALSFQKMFGKGNFFIELQNELKESDKLPLWIQPLIVDCLRQVSKKTGIPAIASSDPHYANPEDAQHQRTMVMINMRETEETVSQMFDKDSDDIMVFFGSDNFYMHSFEEMSKKFTKEELSLTNNIAESIEAYEISRKPMLPTIEIDPKDVKYTVSTSKIIEDNYLFTIAIEGAKKYKPWETSGINKEEYWERLKHEMAVISEAGLAPYFLVVWDYCMAAQARPKDHSFDWKQNLKSNGELDPIPIGIGRGCFLPDTEILMHNGVIKKIQDCKTGDLVITHLGNTKKINSVHKYQCNEEIVELTIANRSLFCTKDHEIFNGIEFKKADSFSKSIKNGNLSTKNKTFVSMSIPNGTLIDKLDLVKICDLNSVNDQNTQWIYKWDDNNIYLYNGSLKKKKYPRYIEANRDLGVIIGFYISEGYARSSTTGFCFHKNEIQYREEISRIIFDIFKIKTTEIYHKTKNSCQLFLYDKLISRMFSFFGNNLANFKKINDHIFNINNFGFEEGLIYGLFSGDGCILGERVSYSTCSYDLINQIKFILLKMGIYTNVCRYKRQQENHKDELTLRISGKQLIIWNKLFPKLFCFSKHKNTRNQHYRINNHFLDLVKDKKYHSYNGYVYDLEVEDDKSYIANWNAVHNSAAGCLVSALIGITDILSDPLKYDLLFARFYNTARNTKDNVEMPDIDVDFATEGREWVIEYLKWKYGDSKVSQIITFQRIQGRAAIKDVFRVKGIVGGFEIANSLSKFIPNEAEIADEIQEAKDSGLEDYGILQWAIDNNKEISDYYKQDEYKSIFEDAMKLEGKQRGKGKHPSGVIVTENDVSTCFPMSYDTKTKERVIGIDYKDVATCGGVKLDILGVSVLDKLKLVQDLVNGSIK